MKNISDQMAHLLQDLSTVKQDVLTMKQKQQDAFDVLCYLKAEKTPTHARAASNESQTPTETSLGQSSLEQSSSFCQEGISHDSTRIERSIIRLKWPVST